MELVSSQHQCPADEAHALLFISSDTNHVTVLKNAFLKKEASNLAEGKLTIEEIITTLKTINIF